MRSGVCPKCREESVYEKENGFMLGTSSFGLRVRIGFWMPAATQMSYLCTKCGYLELYVRDRQKLKTVEEKWVKVRATRQDSAL
jgi:predicted nucleic-acid-binding Zn-ribbon protein